MACNQQKETEHSKETYYFNLKDYFHKEAQILSIQRPRILKQVSRNESHEKKEIRIEDWERELALFLESDINKVAWRYSYDEINHYNDNQDTLKYVSKDTSLRTQEIVIIRKDSVIKEIAIKNKVENYLYTSREELYYYPDSLYKIQKNQQVIVLGSNNYQISGRFLK